MNLLKRFYNLVASRLRSFLDWAESPEDKLNHFLGEMNSRLADLRSAVASAIVEEKKLKKELENLRDRSISWEQRAVAALSEGREDLAKDAIAERQKVEKLGAELHQSWLIQQEAVNKLKSHFETVRAKVSSARAEFQVSLARYKAASAQRSLVIDGENGGSPVKLLDDLNDKVTRIEAESEVALLFSGNEEASVEEAFQKLEHNRSIEQELNELKQRLDGAAKRPELPEA